jgi:hypothetical protein
MNLPLDDLPSLVCEIVELNADDLLKPLIERNLDSDNPSQYPSRT